MVMLSKFLIFIFEVRILPIFILLKICHDSMFHFWKYYSINDNCHIVMSFCNYISI